MIVCEEQHDNEKRHYHVYIEFADKVKIRNADKHFDFMGVHANVRVVRATPWNVVVYVKKDGNFIVHGEIRAKEPAEKKRKKDDIYGEAFGMAKDGDLKAAVEHLLTNDPRHYATHSKAIGQTLEQVATAAMATNNPLPVFNDGWTDVANAVTVTERVAGETYLRVPVLVGPSGIGKTELAIKVLKQAGCRQILIARHLEDLKSQKFFDGVVFDELKMNVKKSKDDDNREQQIGLVDRAHDSTIECRHSNAKLPAHVHRVITTNHLIRALDFIDPAIARRITVHAFTEKLFV
jgi:hypothetical protein